MSLHTQPGTGVIRFQFSLISSNSASQYIFQPIIVNHTSITIVFLLIFSSFSSQGTQAAHTTISDMLFTAVLTYVHSAILAQRTHNYVLDLQQNQTSVRREEVGQDEVV